MIRQQHPLERISETVLLFFFQNSMVALERSINSRDLRPFHRRLTGLHSIIPVVEKISFESRFEEVCCLACSTPVRYVAEDSFVTQLPVGTTGSSSRMFIFAWILDRSPTRPPAGALPACALFYFFLQKLKRLPRCKLEIFYKFTCVFFFLHTGRVGVASPII